jgi:hypothetical protein
MFPFLNRTRLHETVATDTMFSSSKDFSGAWCAQAFYGLSSHVINMYGMKSETEGPEALDDFGRYEGIPAIIRSDNSKMQWYGKWGNTELTEWLTSSEHTEPHHPQQNPAELHVCRWMEENIKTLRMRTGAPKTLRLTMAKHLADIQIPLAKWKVETLDVSAFLHFKQ